MALSPPPKALFFDVFGTCVDWRTTVVGALQMQAHAALNSASASLASSVRLRASEMTPEQWGVFAQQWRDGYKKFTMSLADDPSLPWVSVDEHHLNSLKELAVQWKIEGLWDDVELRTLSLIWHHLAPWDDSGMGVALLNRMCNTCTLSNGNISLLSDLRSFSEIPFTHLFSAEMFGTYKPSPKVYLGAAEKMGLPPQQCAMVAAHLNDLEAAKQNGLQTIYVERPGEEDWSEEQVAKAKEEGWVDLWIDGNSKGFITVAEKLGINVTGSGEGRRLSTSAPIGVA
ncbi:haloacid dehalogenase [Plenodomus tracheiphilus IPT5]|uniref:Haloacid dehalogenase n=1 Tax=Plenodomus tracheiphilus IPT5 TaxID=1408161 RepID=A0A6A7BEL2_9PLEO|nr:haloacid dehalogenase [Plenodomus tracheiphilus IPT5]